MILTLRVKDETHLKYAEHDPNNPSRAMERQLERFKEFSPTDRAVILSNEERKALEEMRGLSFESGAELVEWVKRLKSYEVEGIAIPLSEGQLKRAHYLSEKTSFSLKEWLERKVKDSVSITLLGA